MTTRLLKVGLTALALVALISAPAFAQGGATSSIAGVVTDSGGGVIPGATITATNDRTAGVSTAVSNASGSFTIPALNVGKYTVTVALQGFKTAVLKDVEVTASTPANVKAVLEVGGLSETVVVEGASAVIQTQSSAAASTVTTNQIANLPVGSRSTLEFVTFLPGVQTPGGSRDSIVNGLPQSSIAITLDGVSIQDNHLKTGDGFFARLSPRLDAVEEVTLTSAGNGANSSSQGATQIQFTTRSGSNMFTGSAYHYFQHDKLNANSYFNIRRGLPKNQATQYQPGMRVGGPVVIPGIYDGRGKAFFFVNYEESRTPRTINTVSDFLTPEAQAGIFRYTGSDGVFRSVNLYQLAAQNGQTSTPDPLIGRLLDDIAGSSSQGIVEAIDGNPNARRLRFQQNSKGLTRYPTVRVDYNLNSMHRLTGSWSFNDLVSTPDTTNDREPRFPGFPVTGAQVSDRYVFTTALRSSISTNIVNELRYGMSGGATLFSPGLASSMWSGPFANQGGFDLGIEAAGFAQTGGDNSGITPAGSGGGYSAREASTKFIESTLNWLKGSHSISTGFNYTQADVWLLTETRAGTIDFTLPTGDPALAMFSSGNFASSSSAQRNAARDLYAVLTGHISSIGGTARLDQNTGKYVYNGPSRQEGRLREVDLFLQDSWKMRPNLSLNAGLRYAMQLPFYAKFGTYSTATPADIFGVSGYRPECDLSNATLDTCNLFKPGVLPGTVTTYKNFAKGENAYNTDWNNLAPSVGVNWTPSSDGGFMRKLLGEPGDTSLSFGWARAYERHGMSDFTGVFGGNPGLTVNANRNLNNGNLGTLPLLLRDGNTGPPPACTGAVTAACIPDAPVYPIAATTSGSVNIFDPNLQIPFSDSWTVGFQRAVGRRAAFEVRYIGTRNKEQWRAYNFNEVNILDNGFIDEFQKAQGNLYANIAAGRGETFAYFGPGTGTAPLPIYLAHFSGTDIGLRGECGSIAACQTLYSSSSFTSDDFYNALSRFNANPFTPAGTNSNTGLRGSATRRANAIRAGLPTNFWIANPDVSNANVTGNGGLNTRFNGLQMQFRRRMSGGLQYDLNYAYGKAYEGVRYSFRVPFISTRNTGGEGDVTHAIKGTFVYEVPFGQGKRFGTNAGPVMERIVGGWQVSGTVRVQTGELIDLGNVNVVGMSLDEVQGLFKTRFTGGGNTPIYSWPQDIIDNTIKAYSRDINGFTRGEPTGKYFAPAGLDGCIEKIAGGYGDCGLRSFVITAPWQRNFDMSIVKDVKLTGRRAFQLRFDLLNALNVVDFDAESGVGATTLADWEVTGANGPRVIQLVTRFSW